MPAPSAVPRPEEARGPADFLDLMRRLRQWSGLPLSELEDRMRADGAVTPSGIEGFLQGGTPPSRDLTASFVTACGLPPDERERWLLAYDRLCGPSAAVGNEKWFAELPPMNLDLAAAAVPTAPTPAPGNGSEHRAAPPPRPWNRRSAPRASGGRRRVSLLVAAPAIITIAVVASTLPGVFGGGAEPHRPRTAPGTSGETAPPPGGRAAPPPPGWYTVMPLAYGDRTGNCLSILPDDRMKPRLAQDRCVAEDPLQRIRLAAVPASAGTFQLRAYTAEGQLRCATLDTPAERSPLPLEKCGDDPRQRFGLAPVDGPVKGGPLFRIVPQATGGDGMCVGIGVREVGALEAIHTACARSGVRGYLFSPAAAP
ncbi:helix-turn-helix domain-containing protein [Actinomadura sp. NPDC000600]|uniref:helix-turn-helix domain-containing protein n=1 Tax=Actinomadura sp. NPDC000600 TaxID=3154262 RepID=UPI0033917001